MKPNCRDARASSLEAAPDAGLEMAATSLLARSPQITLTHEKLLFLTFVKRYHVTASLEWLPSSQVGAVICRATPLIVQLLYRHDSTVRLNLDR